MKLGYVLIDSFESTGVANKIIYKVNSLSKQFEEVTCYCFSFSFNADFVKRAGKNFVFHKLDEIKIPAFFNKRFLYRFQLFYYYRKLYAQIYPVLKREHKDVFLFRFPGADLYLLWMTFRLSNRIVFEHNTIEIDELKMNAGRYLNNYFIRSEKYITPIIHAFSKGIISVTDEIRKYHAEKSLVRKRSATITNAIDVSAFKLREPLAFNGKTINVVTVIGSGVKDWYGLDRFFKALDNYKGGFDFRIYIVGDNFEAEIQQAERLNLKQVHFLGKKSSAELNEIYQTMHVGMSAFCLFRKKMQEGASLKAREYGLVGLPMFYAYTEVGFDKCEQFSDFFLQFPNDESLLDLDAVGNFVTAFYTNPANPKNLREFMVSEFNYDKKALEIKAFVESL